METLLISIHLPKTAGQTVYAALHECYGDRLLLDYGDRPLHTGPLRRYARVLTAMAGNVAAFPENVSCVHGHFLPLKYWPLKALRPTCFITWMRNPVQRLVSHYQYWLRTAPSSPAELLHHRMLSERWTLEQFAFCREMRNIYSMFLWGFPIRQFEMVGIVEEFESEFEWLCRNILKKNIHERIDERNVNPGKPLHGSYGLAPELEKAIAEYHRRDMQLYETALTMRRERLSRGG